MGGPVSGIFLFFLLLLRGGCDGATATSLSTEFSLPLPEATSFPNVSFQENMWENTVGPQVSGLEGSVDDRGVCHCSVLFPAEAFPAQRVEALEAQAHSLSVRYDREFSKVTEYIEVINRVGLQLVNLTQRVEHMSKSQVSYTELDFELLRLEIQEMERLVVQLKASLGGSNVVVQQLYVEIKNMSQMVIHLESLDKNNVLAIRREIASLKQRLRDCEEANAIQQVEPGSCKHGGLVNISKPYPVEWNWRGSGYPYGVWGKDYSPGNPAKENYWVVALDNAQLMQYVYLYSSFDNLLLYRTSRTFTYRYGQGSGATMYKNALFFNQYNTNQVSKFDLNSNSVVLTKALPGAVYNNRFSYAGVSWQDIDLAVDETGLWAIYSTESNTGNIMISKLNDSTLEVEKTWHTRQYKPSASSAFVICGVLYVTRSLNTNEEEVFYTFDTNTGKEGRTSITIGKPFRTVQGVNYHPADHKLYVYNDGFLLTYDLEFQPLPNA